MALVYAPGSTTHIISNSLNNNSDTTDVCIASNVVINGSTTPNNDNTDGN